MVVAGQNVMPGMELYKIADLSTVWAMASVYQEELPFIKARHEGEIEVPSATGRTFTGRVEFISPLLDAATKTAAVRICDPQHCGACPEAADVCQCYKFPRRLPIKALSVSQQAVLHTGQAGHGHRLARQRLFQAAGSEARHERRRVHAGSFRACEGETIVTSSQFLIDAESNLKEAVGQMSGRKRRDSAEKCPERAR